MEYGSFRPKSVLSPSKNDVEDVDIDWAGRLGPPPTLQPDTNNTMLSSELDHRANRSEHYMSCSSS